MSKSLKILIADDHAIVATGVKAILDTTEHNVLDVVSNGQEVLDVIEFTAVDLILMDINMPIMNGIECTRKVKKINPEIKVIILTMYNQKQFIRELLEVGADGCVLKSNTGKELITAIDRVSSGKTYFDHINEFIDPVRELKEYKLSEREIEVILQISEGYTSREIADRLFISEHTVKTHRKNIFRKLELKGTSQLIQFAMNNGLIG